MHGEYRVDSARFDPSAAAGLQAVLDSAHTVGMGKHTELEVAVEAAVAAELLVLVLAVAAVVASFGRLGATVPMLPNLLAAVGLVLLEQAAEHTLLGLRTRELLQRVAVVVRILLPVVVSWSTGEAILRCYC